MANYNTYTGLNAEADAIAAETVKKANTASRIGLMFKGILNYLNVQFQSLTAVSANATVATSGNVAITLVNSSFKFLKTDFTDTLVVGNVIFAKNQSTITEIGIYQITTVDDKYYTTTRQYTVYAINKVYVLQGNNMGTWQREGNGVTVSFISRDYADIHADFVVDNTNASSYSNSDDSTVDGILILKFFTAGDYAITSSYRVQDANKTIFVKEPIKYYDPTSGVASQWIIPAGLYKITSCSNKDLTTHTSHVKIKRICLAARLMTVCSDNATEIAATAGTSFATDAALREMKGIWRKQSDNSFSKIEEQGNKVSAITDANKTSLTLYPSNAAVTAQRVEIDAEISSLGISSIKEGNIAISNGSGALTDSGQRPVKVCSDFSHWKAYNIEVDSSRGTVLFLDATNPTTGEYYGIDDEDIVRFYVPRVNFGSNIDVAGNYQDYGVVVRVYDKVLQTMRTTVVSSITAMEKGVSTKIKDVYGACFDIQLVRGNDTSLYARTMYGLTGDEIVTHTVATTTSVTLSDNTTDSSGKVTVNNTITVIATYDTAVGLTNSTSKAIDYSDVTEGTNDATAITAGAGLIVLPSMDADKSVIFVCGDSKGVQVQDAIANKIYKFYAGDTVSCSYISDDDAWYVNGVIQAEIKDYTDIHADFVVDNTNASSYSNSNDSTVDGILNLQFFTAGDYAVTSTYRVQDANKTIFVKEPIKYYDPTSSVASQWIIPAGLYQIRSCSNKNLTTHTSRVKIKRICLASRLMTVCSDNATEIAATAGTSFATDAALREMKGIWRKQSDNSFSKIEEQGNKVSDVTTATAPATQYPNVTAVTNYVTNQIKALVNSSPAALDTLKELADALGDDANFSTTITNLIAGKVSLTGNETVAGIKSFSSLVKALAGLYASGNVQLDLGSDAAGDMLYRGSDGYLKRLPKGSAGQVLTLASGIPAWGSIADSNVSFAKFAINGTSITTSFAQIPLSASEDYSNASIYLSNNMIKFTQPGNYLFSAQIMGLFTTAGTGLLYLIKNGSINVAVSSFANTTDHTIARLVIPVNIASTDDYLTIGSMYSDTEFIADNRALDNFICVTKLGAAETTSSTISISETNPSSVITITTTQQHLALTQNYVKNWSTNYYTAPKAGTLEVSGYIEWSAVGGTTNPLKIFLIVNGTQKTVGSGSQGSTGKVAQIALCGTVDVNAGDTIYIDGILSGNTATISTNSEIKFKITD